METCSDRSVLERNTKMCCFFNASWIQNCRIDWVFFLYRFALTVHEIGYGWRLKRECQQNWCVSYTHLKCINRILLLQLLFHIIRLHFRCCCCCCFSMLFIPYPLLTDTIFFVRSRCYPTSKRIYIRLIHLSIERSR